MELTLCGNLVKPIRGSLDDTNPLTLLTLEFQTTAGKISFDDFVKWISDERDKTSQQAVFPEHRSCG